jgi:hypothetical protein
MRVERWSHAVALRGPSVLPLNIPPLIETGTNGKTIKMINDAAIESNKNARNRK